MYCETNLFGYSSNVIASLVILTTAGGENNCIAIAAKRRGLSSTRRVHGDQDRPQYRNAEISGSPYKLRPNLKIASMLRSFVKQFLCQKGFLTANINVLYVIHCIMQTLHSAGLK